MQLGVAAHQAVDHELAAENLRALGMELEIAPMICDVSAAAKYFTKYTGIELVN